MERGELVVTHLDWRCDLLGTLLCCPASLRGREPPPAPTTLWKIQGSAEGAWVLKLLKASRDVEVHMSFAFLWGVCLLPSFQLSPLTHIELT